MKPRKPNPNRDRARDIAKQIAAMPETERQAFGAAAPVASIEGRALSLANMILAKRQAPVASIVGGFRQWIRAGRCVKQGETAIYIWIPSTRRADGADDDSAETETRFMLAPVFDVSQTAELAENEARAA